MSTSGPRSQAFGAALLFGAGGTLVLLTLLLPHGTQGKDLGVAVPPVLAFLVVLGLFRFGERISLRAMEVIIAFGGVLVSGCVVWGGESAGAYALMYVFVALYAYAYFPAWEATAVVGVTMAGYAAALALSRVSPVSEVAWLMGTGTVFVSGALIGRLAWEVRSQARDLAAVAGIANEVTTVEDVDGARRRLCDAACATTSAAAAVLLEDGGETARSGDPALADRLADGDLPPHLERAIRVDGRPRARLAVAWRRAPRRIPERRHRGLDLLAGQGGAMLERAQRISGEHERRALELNDNVVQGLVVARYALDAGRHEVAGQAVDQTLARARQLMSDQLDGLGPGGVQPGDLRRGEAVGASG